MISQEKNQFIFRMNDTGTGPHLLQQVCLERGWRLYESGKEHGDPSGKTWNLWWRTKRFPVFERRHLDKEQFTNHIPNASFICGKDNLIRILKCMRRIHGSFYDFMPDGYNLPSEYKKLIAEITVSKQKMANFNDTRDAEIWICKPVGLSQGRGISLFQYSSDLVYNSKAVVQKYVKNPLLVGGYKFDLRLYVLVPSFHPLTIYIYKEGLVRFGTEKFSLKNLQNPFAHLTNSSLNKSSPGYTKTKERVGTGCKWNLQQLRCYLRQTIGPNWLLWQHISVIVVLTLVSQSSKISRTVNSFEFYGFDVLIDSTLKPWLIEVNSSPALTTDCRIDSLVKKPMLHDMFDLIGLPDLHERLPTFDESCDETRSRPCRTSRLREKKIHSKSKPRVGNWVRIFPLLATEHDRVKLPTNGHRAYNEIRSVVSLASSYLKIAKEVQTNNPDLEENELNELMTNYLLPDATIWLPPM